MSAMLNGAMNVVRRITWTVDDRQGIEVVRESSVDNDRTLIRWLFFLVQKSVGSFKSFPMNAFSVCNTQLLPAEGFKDADSRDASTVAARSLFDSVTEVTMELCSRSPNDERKSNCRKKNQLPDQQ